MAALMRALFATWPSRQELIVRLCALCLLSACQATPPTPDAAQPVSAEAQWQRPEALIVAKQPDAPMLDIGVVLFDPGVAPEDDSPEATVRRLEASLLAHELKTVLERSNQWGVVRLVPEASRLTPLSLHSKVLLSDGRDLVVRVTARDAMSQEWFSQTIAYRESPSGDATSEISQIFHSLSNRLLQSWEQYSARNELIMASEILYAQTLIPDAFAGMLSVSDIGWQLDRLPANNDPMLARISRVRNQEYLFCDAIDEQYGDLALRVAPTYALWRRATAEQALWLEQYEERVSERGDNAGDGRFARMQAHYAAYRSYRIQEQALWELAEAFEGESQPTMLKTASRVVRLEGTLESQYDEWRQILRNIFILEQGAVAW